MAAMPRRYANRNHVTLGLSLAGTAIAPVLDAQASIVYFGNSNKFTIVIEDLIPSIQVGWDIDGGGINETRFLTYEGQFIDLGYGSENFLIRGTVFDKSDFVQLDSKFSQNLFTIIDTTYVFFGQIADGETGFIGFTFFSETDNQQVFGWAEILADINNDSSTNLTVLRWAYDNTGAAIHVPVSAPPTSSLALLGMGAAGVIAWRRRRDRKTPQYRKRPASRWIGSPPNAGLSGESGNSLVTG
jgi:hypothetical protein